MKRLVLFLALFATLALPAHGSINFSFYLDGKQAVPRVNTFNSGHCVATVELGSLMTGVLPFSIGCSHDVGDVVSAEIHRGAPGETGPLLYTFPDPDNVEGHFDLNVEQALDMGLGNYYLVLKSSDNPSGEIRGQILALPLAEDETVFFDLVGESVVPPVQTQARGSCLASVSPSLSEVTIACTHDVSDPVAAFLRIGVPGTNGPVVIEFPVAQSPLLIMATEPELAERIRNGELYIEVTSPTHPGGEIRGQAAGCFASNAALCLNRDRFRVEVTWRDFENRTGRGTAVPLNPNSGLFWFFTPDNTELLIKVLDACVPVLGNKYWVFLAGTTSVEVDVTVTDTLRGDVWTYNNPLGVDMETQLDVAAFDTCP